VKSNSQQTYSLPTIFSAMATFTAKSNTTGANHVLEVNVMKPMYPITTVSFQPGFLHPRNSLSLF
jgi:hypothetical protein